MSAINELTERERDILILRYGLNKNGPMTLDEIGKGYGLTRERIRQIEEKTLSKLRNKKEIKNLSIYMENPDKVLKKTNNNSPKIK